MDTSLFAFCLTCGVRGHLLNIYAELNFQSSNNLHKICIIIFYVLENGITYLCKTKGHSSHNKVGGQSVTARTSPELVNA